MIDGKVSKAEGVSVCVGGGRGTGEVGVGGGLGRCWSSPQPRHACLILTAAPCVCCGLPPGVCIWDHVVGALHGWAPVPRWGWAGLGWDGMGTCSSVELVWSGLACVIWRACPKHMLSHTAL